jgi:hypothetical protein
MTMFASSSHAGAEKTERTGNEEVSMTLFSEAPFGTDERGRFYYKDNVSQLTLLGVERIYHGRVHYPYRADTARLIHGHCFVPDDHHRRQGVVYITRVSLESVLWRYRHGSDAITEVRSTLLKELRFDTDLAYEVYLDHSRDLYVFVTIPHEAAGAYRDNSARMSVSDVGAVVEENRENTTPVW